MDEFGVLVESIGFKSQRNSAPMSHLKAKPKTNFSFNDGFPDISSANPSKAAPFYSTNDSFVDDLDGIFQSKKNNYSNSQKSQNFFDAGDDIFMLNSKPQKGEIDLDSVFDLKNSNSKPSPDFYGDDLLTSGPRKGDAIDDLFENFGGLKSENLKQVREEKGSKFDDLIPGFGGTSPSSINDSRNIRMASKPKPAQPSSVHSSKSTSSAVDDPFLVFESSRNEENASSWPFSDPLEQNAEKSSVESSIDELEKFAMGGAAGDACDKPNGATLRNIRISLEKKDGKARNNSSDRNINTHAEILHEKRREKYKDRVDKVTKEKTKAVVNDDNVDDIFGMNTSANVKGPRSQAQDPVFDALFNEKREPEVKETSIRGTVKTSIVFDGFSSLFGEADSSSGVFQEIDGESEERRRARLNHHIRTQERMAKALAEKNQRDLQTQYEQEERRRLAESLDYDIKRWSAGKEGNLRSLLSSLQDVLWPECGWQPVSWNDLITPTSVKKVYHKANLCVHPDKVQQKGANLQQKYIAEKVFDLLKDAFKKFSAAEL